MAQQAKRQRTGSHVLMAIVLLFLFCNQAHAQKKDYAAGERIEYRSSGYPEVWEDAIFLNASPDGSQPIIRQMPSEFQKEGFQRAASWAEIRAKPSAREASPAETPRSEIAASDTGADSPSPEDATPDVATTDHGTGLMTQADVIGFLQTRLGDTPFQNPRRDEIKQELAEIIKARGLDFRFTSFDAAFNTQLSKFGATSDIIFPIRDNYGAPPSRDSLMGAWQLGKIGATVDYVRDNYVYRQGEIGVANIGTLVLNANGTFDWQSDTNQSTRGKWREATSDEMQSQGGAGIVLIDAKGGYKWIVMKDRRSTLAGEWIAIAQLDSRQIREFGSRNGKK